MTQYFLSLPHDSAAEKTMADIDPAELEGLPRLELSDRSYADLEMLATGAYSPLQGFVGEADYLSIIEHLRLADGTAVGVAGELLPKLLETSDLPARTVAVELDLDALTDSATHQGVAIEVPAYDDLQVSVDDVTVEDSDVDEQVEALRERFATLKVVGIDRDPEAIALASARLARFGDRFVSYRTRFDGVTEALEDLMEQGKAGKVVLSWN